MAALSAASTVDKWDLLPKAVADEFKEDVLKEEQYVTLAKSNKQAEVYAEAFV